MFGLKFAVLHASRLTRCVLKLDFAHAWRGKSINVYNRTHSLFMRFWDERRLEIGEKPRFEHPLPGFDEYAQKVHPLMSKIGLNTFLFH